MKTPNDYAQVKFRPGSNLERKIATRIEKESNLSLTTKQLVDEHCTLLDLCLPGFSRGEREVLWHALNGRLTTPENVDQLWVEVDALIGIYEPNGVDMPMLVSRVHSLSRFECWAVYDAFRRGALCPDR